MQEGYPPFCIPPSFAFGRALQISTLRCGTRFVRSRNRFPWLSEKQS